MTLPYIRYYCPILSRWVENPVNMEGVNWYYDGNNYFHWNNIKEKWTKVKF